MSGRRRGLFASLMRFGLWMASLLYAFGSKIRNRGFDSGRREILKADVPVISVGNLTTGGTGKTPIVAWIARSLRDRQKRVAIISRGYGRGDLDHNDEAMELYQRLPDVPHLQDPDRYASATIAVEELESEVILMDDGFQHRRLHRDLDIVLIDVTCPFGFGHMLPRGLLRESISSLARADLAILTRCDQVDPDTIDGIKEQILNANSNLPIMSSVHQPGTLLEHPGKRHSIDLLKDSRVCTVCGIGNPNAFKETVRSCGADIVDSRDLADHAAFDSETVSALHRWVADLSEVTQVICTQKDLVKLQTDRLGGKPVRALTIEAVFDDDFELVSRLEKLVP